ncbi:ATP-binding cassette transporter [Cryptococcus neoformans var. grubii Br795]|uniref:ATP-binding cassette transporter n=1 Tax=Cryptococcus neoformans Tu259-1 TaxID=1230072 RepID=A0A854QBV7_CRYNE|nr:ATP-binding cassette transporter [Cryptococcus neoformans var. grubii AD1-83a]OXG21344.1 ATP-binding cassette transporter [Cryptococcus neoformans var. grubii Tu259-1]OXG50800.1 ATP-binding cassette transporter [Cryptococcus neoformans var. grubii Th84]OXG59676.1 ATP-binding cassette transporter [Cryptococcus neoformans var. grubii MW-RSA1955]OXG63880.1 ATP-binding cassette transporter [Cryptococcus neoformans var. grubii c8]OXG64681.1 ATP-binding cassette transporter [Cryptococcus neoforma
MAFAGVGQGLGTYDRTEQTSGASLGRVASRAHFTDTHPSDDLPAQTEEHRAREVGHLARQLTRQSVGGTDDSSALFSYQQGSDLDPFSDKFCARRWTKLMFEALQTSGPARKAGLSFRNLDVHGFGSDADYQKTVGNLPLVGIGALRDLISNRKRKVQILNSMDGVLEAGEMLVVLGPPGSGCTTMLKTIAGEMNGIYLDESSSLNYRGITPKQIYGQFRGEAIYTAEVDVHFPNLTVGQTLSFAAEARAPRNPPGGISKKEYAKHMRDVVMSVFGISHTLNTIVGNDFIRGVSGGERKRVTIAEASLAGAPLQCWDNSTRGLDSANAIEFCKNLRLNADYIGISSAVAIYQAPQAAYDCFDKVSVLYEGEQIFFGKTTDAKQFFVDMGFHCPSQQTVPDFLTSLTSASERTPREGFEGKVPTTPQEFAARWKQSDKYQELLAQIAEFENKYPVHGKNYQEFLQSRRAQQSKRLRAKSPYTLSYGGQVELCLRRGFDRLRADPSLTLTQLFGNFIMALIIGSVFYNLPATTSSFYSRGALLFFAILMSAFGSALEILILYAQRGIVEKHSRYAFYHPSAEAVASALTDIPYKVINCIIFSLTLYFMTNLRREPGPYFFFMLISFTLTMVMSMLFRSIASLSRSLAQALAPAALLILGLVMYTGFAVNVANMRGWARWMNWLDPIAYGFESLMINEFHDREYECSAFIPMGPGYEGATGQQHVCSTAGAIAGSSVVNGDDYINLSYEYYHAHKWRNFGILIGFFLFFTAIYMAATEFITAKKSKGEILVFPRGKIPRALLAQSTHSHGSSDDVEGGKFAGGSKMKKQITGADRADAGIIQRQTAIFSWKDVVYDIKIKKEPRRILDHVDGWVKPGTLTALMGVSGAGKTTLLDVLATRVTMGVVTGEMLVDGRQRDVSFQRKTGYVQQQDLHLETSTVREALRFSAVLRQSNTVSIKEKYEYVEEVLKLLEMESYADAVVGVPGTGLNVEQRKRLTIGVELVAKPALLLFLDEPTSGLDSQTSWNILLLLRKLTEHGQAILCTIHQPSAMLFEQFDRLLFLARGGKTVYFGEVGKGSHILIDYFEKNGAPKCPEGENPAEWMLAAIGAAPGSHSDVDWHQAWINSPERVEVRRELARIKETQGGKGEAALQNKDHEKSKSEVKAEYAEFASPLWKQFNVVLTRVWQQHWRTPSYIWSKAALCALSALFIGFSFFKSGTSQQGLQNQLFSVFMMFTIFGQLTQQIMPNFTTQRSLYEVRERPSKTYSWKIFILSNIVAEIPWAILMGAVIYFTWYYPIGYYRNAIPTGAVHLRGALMFLYIEMFLIFNATFAIMIVAGIATAETAGNIANLLFSMCLIFCGVLAPPSSLPGFWMFMYRVSPFTYLVDGMLSTAVAETSVVCSDIELLTLNPPSGESCGDYMSTYISNYGGYLVNENATTACEFCSMSSTNTFLAQFNIHYSNKWRDFGLLWAYVVFNIIAAVGIYWLARVPKNTGKEQASEPEDLQEKLVPAQSSEKKRESVSRGSESTAA